MPVNLCPEADLVNMGRGKMFSPMGDNNKKLFQTDSQLHNGQTRDSVHYPSTTHSVLPPQSTVFRPLHRIDNLWKTSGDNMCPLR
jgi:hypothetical protein